jgi:hypothetical protein
MAKRAYYVVYSDGMWRVKLERGPNLSKHRKKQRAIEEAKRLARKSGNAGSKVVINSKEGATLRHVTPQ